jgi:hypothetical protein
MATGVGVALLVVFRRAVRQSPTRRSPTCSARAMPDVDGTGVFGAAWRFVVFGWGAIGLAYLATRPPTLDRIAQGARRPVHRLEWLLPIVLLDLLFAAFVAVQLRAWFGGDEYVAPHRRPHLRRARPQRLLAAHRRHDPDARGHRGRGAQRRRGRPAATGRRCASRSVRWRCSRWWWFASALARMAAYEDAYGLTRLRLLVFACELWFGLDLRDGAVAGAGLRPFGRQKGGWLPRTVFGAGVAMLLGLARAQPGPADRRPQHRQVLERRPRRRLVRGRTRRADAAPALDRLPPRLREWRAAADRRDLSDGRTPGTSSTPDGRRPGHRDGALARRLFDGAAVTPFPAILDVRSARHQQTSRCGRCRCGRAGVGEDAAWHHGAGRRQRSRAAAHGRRAAAPAHGTGAGGARRRARSRRPPWRADAGRTGRAERRR